MNGPGFDGGTNTNYLSTVHPGFTVEQGTYENNRDSNINIVDYSKSDITSNTIFAFSGSGTDREEVPECAKSKFIPQVDGVDKPATFFTELKLKEKSELRCKLPDPLPQGDGLIVPARRTMVYILRASCVLECSQGYFSSSCLLLSLRLFF